MVRRNKFSDETSRRITDVYNYNNNVYFSSDFHMGARSMSAAESYKHVDGH